MRSIPALRALTGLLRGGAGRRLLGLLLAAAASILPAQGTYRFRSYGPDQGLTNLATSCITQDATGYIWVGTEGGAFRYDGQRFLRFAQNEGIADAVVNDIRCFSNGAIVVITTGGIFRFDGRTLKAIVPASAADRTYRERRVAAVSKDDVWIAGQGDVRHWDGRAWTVFDLPIANPTLAVRGKDVYASGTYGGILKKQ